MLDQINLNSGAVLDESNAPQGPVTWVFERADLLQMAEMIRTASEVVMDLETTGLDEHAVTGGRSNGGVAARISMASLTLPQLNADREWDGEEAPTFIVPLSHPDSPWVGEWRKVMRLISRAMVKYRSLFVNHHAKFDARWGKATTGVDIANLIHWDTQSAAFVLDEIESTSLKDTVPRVFGVPRWDDHDLSTPGASERVDLWELGEYAARDTYWTWRLYRSQIERMFLTSDPFIMPIGREEIADARRGTLAEYVSMPTAKSLAIMEQRGIMLDQEYTRQQLEEQRTLATEKLDELADRFSLPRDKASTAATSGWFKELAEIAMQRGELEVVSRTKTGNPQWDKFVLGKLSRRGSEVASLILEQRDAAKQAEFLQSWLDKVTPDGTIHSTYRAAKVVTGRLSSADPNMQQVSKKLRPAFIPRPGYVLADLDYSQLELRVAAFISRSEPMMQAFQDGLDLHTLFAADLLNRARKPGTPEITLDQVPPEDRQRAKAGNFGLLYLQEPVGFQSYAEKLYGVEMTEAEAIEVYKGFFTTWEGMRQWHQRTIASAAKNGYITSPIGRVRNLPNITDRDPSWRSSAERQAVNAPVQGFGSDIMQIAIASIYGNVPGRSRVEGVYPVSTVHDSLVAEVEEDRWEELVAECQDRMVNPHDTLLKMGCDLDVPLKADATVGTRWGWSDIAGED